MAKKKNNENVIQVPKSDPKVKVWLVYSGLVPNGDEFGHLWFTVKEDWEKEPTINEETGRRMYKGDSKFVRPAVGNVYEFEAPPDSTAIFLDTGRYIGRWPNEVWIAEHQLTNDVHKQVAALKADEKKNTKRKTYLEVLEPIRRAYERANPTEKALIMARVAKAISGRVNLKPARLFDD